MATKDRSKPWVPTRPCLGGCKRMIPHAGPGHRLCPSCNARNQGYSRREARVSARLSDLGGDDAGPTGDDRA